MFTFEFDAIGTRFRSDSFVAQIATATGGGTFHFPDDAIALFDLYDGLHAATSGAVDPLIGRDLELLGYDRDYSFKRDPIAIARYSRDRANWKTDVQRYGSIVVTRRPVVIDVGAAGKAYIVAAMLRNEGIDEFVVDEFTAVHHRDRDAQGRNHRARRRKTARDDSGVAGVSTRIAAAVPR